MLELTTSCYIIPLRIDPTTPTSEKQFCLNDINSSVMQRLDENQRLRAIGMLQTGLAQNVVARHFDCHRNTILSLIMETI